MIVADTLKKILPIPYGQDAQHDLTKKVPVEKRGHWISIAHGSVLHTS